MCLKLDYHNFHTNEIALFWNNTLIDRFAKSIIFLFLWMNDYAFWQTQADETECIMWYSPFDLCHLRFFRFNLSSKKFGRKYCPFRCSRAWWIKGVMTIWDFFLFNSCLLFSIYILDVPALYARKLLFLCRYIFFNYILLETNWCFLVDGCGSKLKNTLISRFAESYWFLDVLYTYLFITLRWNTFRWTDKNANMRLRKKKYVAYFW